MRCECGDHDWKPITKGYVTLVSPQDAALLEVEWHATSDGRGHIYARRNLPQEHGKRRQALLHRAVLAPEGGLVVDHRNANGLDNRRSNLRACTIEQNNRNARQSKVKKVPLKGVVPCGKNTFRARITKDKRQHCLGSFPTPEAAHAAYVRASRVLHGEFGRAA